VTRADPKYADGFVNLARVAIREGLLDEAEPALQEALARDPELPRMHYFMGVARKEQGRYDEALVHFRKVAALYPRDRVVRNAVGRVLFLQRRYAEAVEELQKVLAIDSEDLMAHYNLMLCYRGLGRHEDADAERRLYERFKADEDAQSLLNAYLRENPDENRMRQAIHEQLSAPREVIEREVALRGQNGDPHVVLPGEAEAYARRVVERGRELLAAGAERGRTVATLPPEPPAQAGTTRRQGAP
jgi:tetratricopeptide (TPR) repeat protein